MPRRPVLTVMARWPSPGRCKRRLSADLAERLTLRAADERAARIQRRLCEHTMAVGRELQTSGVLELRLAVSGLGRQHAQRWGHSLGATSTALQGEGSLGCRMRRQFLRSAAAPSVPRQLMIGADLPGLGCDELSSALDALRHVDVVLGPASDGGYWLIGFSAALLKRPQDWPFSGIPWGDSAVLEVTLTQCRQRSLTTQLLSQRNDIDHLCDLAPWLSL